MSASSSGLGSKSYAMGSGDLMGSLIAIWLGLALGHNKTIHYQSLPDRAS